MLEMLGIPYTGSNVLTLALALDKAMAKRVFQQANIPTARFAVLNPGDEISSRGLRFPLFVKPAWEGSSIGVSPASLVRNEEELVRQVEYITGSYKQPALVEEYLEGREFTVGMIGNDELEMLPIREIRFDHCPAEHGPIYSYQYKTQWDKEEYFPCPADIPTELAARIRAVAVSAFRALECRDIGRVDVRLDADGVPNVIEVNPLPGLAPGFSDLPQAAAASGMSYNELTNKILDAAIVRCGLARKAAGYAEVVRSAS
jgi:D-alanine-D-alanine ligase